MKEYNDLMTPKEVLRRNPGLNFTAVQIGYLRFAGVVFGVKGKKENFVSEKSVLEIHDWKFGTDYLK